MWIHGGLLEGAAFCRGWLTSLVRSASDNDPGCPKFAVMCELGTEPGVCAVGIKRFLRCGGKIRRHCNVSCALAAHRLGDMAMVKLAAMQSRVSAS